eukprot:2577489-Prorocentrum_lima.AAC.1
MAAPRAVSSTHSMAATLMPGIGSLFLRYFDLGEDKRTWWRYQEGPGHRSPQDAGRLCCGTS